MPFKTFREFIQLESSGGVVLFIAAIVALIIDNTAWRHYYEALFNLHFTVQIGAAKLSKPLQAILKKAAIWSNDFLHCLAQSAQIAHMAATKPWNLL